MNPEVVDNNKEINARSITTFFNAISSIKNFNQQLPRIQMIGEGSVGPETASLFTLFINNQLDKIISPEDIMTKDEVHVLSSLKNSVGEGDNFRADLSSIIATRVINYCLTYAENNSIDQKMIDRLVKLVTDCESFTTDLKYYMIKEIINGNKSKFAKLMHNPTVVKMAVK